MKCRLCDHNQSTVIYDGPIRAGGIGSGEISGHKVLECQQCGLVFLDQAPCDLGSFYETDEYRSRWDYSFSPEDIHKKYDIEQNERIARIGVQNIRGKAVLDLGASAGVFLDAVQSLASRTVAVEPSTAYKGYLSDRGHAYYPYPKDAMGAGERVDLVTSFDVIEHLPNPRELISAAFSLLVPGGSFVLSMPNVNDIVLKCCRDEYEPFFFQVAHLSYFSSKVVDVLFKGSGFVDVRVEYLHKYGIENLVRWSKYGSPGPINEIDGVFDRIFNEHYRAEVERSGTASHLFITARKDGAQ